MKHLSIFAVALISLAYSYSQTESLIKNSDPIIVEAMEVVCPDSIYKYVEELQNMGTRFMLAPNRKDIANWLVDKFISFGATEVRIDSFLCNTNVNYQSLVYDTITWQYNVEAKIPGVENPDHEVVLMGHYDSITLDGDNMTFAPGANDNATGVAALLECARVVMTKGYQPQQTIIFLALAAEELMYFGDSGAKHYAKNAKQNGQNITMAINNDMIGWNNGSWKMNIYNHADSQNVTDIALNIINNYTSLNYASFTPVSTIGGDIQPFLDEGYKGIYFMENGNYQHTHTGNDIAGNCDKHYLAEITKVSLGSILYSNVASGLLENKKDNDVVIYPNPANKFLSIKASTIYSNIEIYNSSGSLVKEMPFSNYIFISDLPKGIYLIRFINYKGSATKRIVKYN